MSYPCQHTECLIFQSIRNFNSSPCAQQPKPELQPDLEFKVEDAVLNYKNNQNYQNVQ